jgi:crotonobetainyl-CoA:carnitine CoA-transferase CaiB-like acyl-CoA transferase
MATAPELPESNGPLAGIRVIDAGRFVGGPITATILAEFGAQVIKVERPGAGDDLRRLGPIVDGRSLWWSVEGRNKLSITLDLGKPRGQELLKELAAQADVLIENFRPGTLEKWGLAPESLRAVNPGLIILRTSGYGQTGPYKHLPAFNTAAEAMGGLRYLVGEPDRPPARPGIALGDYAGAVFGAIGVLVALYERDARGSGQGQVIDNALYEAVMRLLEWTVAAHDALGTVRERVGAGSAGTAPARAYLAKDGRWVGISAATDAIFRKLTAAMGVPEMGTDPRFVTNWDRIANITALNDAIEAWVVARDADEVIRVLLEAGVPVNLVYTAKDLFQDEHILARESIVRVPDPQFGELGMQNVVPRLERTPGKVQRGGP